MSYGAQTRLAPIGEHVTFARILRVPIWFMAVAVGASACATPVGYSNEPLQNFDKDTEYRIDPREDGFTVTIFHSRYQFIPESDALIQSCKSALLSIAHEHAENVGREIEQVNEQRIRLSLGRNGLTGVTSCTASVPARFLTSPNH